MKIKCFLMLVSVLVATSVWGKETGFYIGGSYLNSDMELLGETDSDSGTGLHFGYSVNENFAVEASKLDLGTVNLPRFPDSGGSIDIDSYGLTVLGAYSLGQINLVGKAGVLWWDGKGYLQTIAGPVGYSDSGRDSIVSIGVSYYFNDKLEVIVDHSQSQEFNWDSVGLNIHF